MRTRGVKRANMAGTSLIEVMVTMLLLAVSTLSTASLLIANKQNAYDANQRAVAAQLVGDITQRIRSNAQARSSYYTPTSGIGNGSLTNSNCTDSSPCSAQQIAASELAAWEDLIAGATETRTVGGNTSLVGGLASPRACISGPAGGGTGLYTIALAWRGNSPLSNPTANTCGSGAGLYGDSDSFRRVLVLSVFLP